MCGIVGYIGPKAAADVVLEGLQALEYRGYDSAGIVALDEQKKRARFLRVIGRVKALKSLVAKDKLSTSHCAIGHTRWATHGAPTEANAHPHHNADNTIFVVHNGIIENYQNIRQRLRREGYTFITETDTEVIPHLIDYYYRRIGSFERAFKAALRDLTGAYAVAALTTIEPDKLFAAKLSSPLVLGIGEGEMLLASDPNALNSHTRKAVYIEDGDVVIVARDDYRIERLSDEHPVDRTIELLETNGGAAGLNGYPHFMLKEIFEAPETIRLATAGRVQTKTGSIKLGGLELVRDQLDGIERIIIVSCGTSSYAGLLGEYLIEELAGIPVEVQLASEFRYRTEPISRSTAVLAISQSGETADTIAALKKLDGRGVLRLGVVNVVGSTIARMTDAGVYCHAGPEQAVASTKAFIAQVTVLLQLALYFGKARHPLHKQLVAELAGLPDKAAAVLSRAAAIEDLARKYREYRGLLYIGRRHGYPTALEGALKLKEVSYIHAEGYAAGEMKHGPIALIDPSFPVVALATDSDILDKLYSNIEEIRARRGRVLAIATEGNKTIRTIADDVVYIPKTLEQVAPILSVIPLQLFAYYVATQKGLDVDRPRNLAKSVTVE